jgi:hypothetical protein
MLSMTPQQGCGSSVTMLSSSFHADHPMFHPDSLWTPRVQKGTRAEVQEQRHIENKHLAGFVLI